MKQYTTHLTTQTPQVAPIPELRHQMTPNRAGGWGFEVDDETRFRRFLVIGSAQGTYYAGGQELTREALTVLDRLIEDGKGGWALDQIIQVSDSGRAPKQEPAILALARCMGTDVPLDVRRMAANTVPAVCRTFDHMASFQEALKAIGRGRGKLVKQATQMFLERPRDQLAYHLIKYRSRQGWTPRDLLRIARPNPPDHLADLYRYAVKGAVAGVEHPQVQAALDIQETAVAGLGGGTEEGVKRAVGLIRQYRLPWEAVPNSYAKNPEVQRALFEGMPMTATIRQAGRLTAAGVFDDPEYVKMATDRLSNQEWLRKARVHPMAVFLAARTYRAGHGDRGKLSWKPVEPIADALDAAFFASFSGVRATGRKTVVGVDCSGSMGHQAMYGTHQVAGINGLQPYLAAFAFAYVTMRTEPNVTGIAFDTRPLEFTLSEVRTLGELDGQAQRIAGQLNGGTDCAVPAVQAHQNISGVEAFLIYTDEETWAGSIHPIEAVSRYREKWGIASKICSVAFAATGYSIRGAMDDAGALAVVGFDAAAPGVIADFLEQPLPVIPQLANKG